LTRMATKVKKLDLKVGDVVEIGGARYDVIPDKQGGLTLEPAITTSAAEAMERRGRRPATAEEFERHFGDLRADGEG
jgi:hypothetical protein